MTIKNLTKNTIISKKVLLAKSISDKIFGMIFARNSDGLILKTRFGIHTFFMKNPTDVLILDSSKKIVRIRLNLGSNKIFVWNPKFNYVIELPANSVKKSKTELGDSLKIW